MNRTIVTRLWVILAIQLLLAIAIGIGGMHFGEEKTDRPLVAFDQKGVDQIRISQGDDTLEISRIDGDWRLPDDFDAPADGAKVELFLEQLAGLKRRLPVATTAEALSRFKVDKERFERRIELRGNDKELATLYLGDSPGVRRVYARGATDDAVYEVEFAIHQAATKGDDWVDRTLLHLDREQMTSIEIGDLRLEKGEKEWTIAGLKAGEEPVQEEVDKLVGTVSGLGFTGITGPKGEEDEEQLATLKIGLKDGKDAEYRISKRGEDHIITTPGREFRFKVGKYEVEDLLGAVREKLVKGPAPAAEAPEAAPAPADAASGGDDTPPEGQAEPVTGAAEGTATETVTPPTATQE